MYIPKGVNCLAVIQEFKCPCCGGAIIFDSNAQKMKCPYCDTEIETEAFISYDEELKNEQTDEMDWEAPSGGEWQSEEAESLRVFICNSCGGEIVGDQNTAATSCPFCSNPVVIKDRLSGDLKPDYIIPFKLDKTSVKEALNRHYKGKRLLPKIFKDRNHIDEVKGIYVPFWLFDTKADADIRYKATRVRSWSDSNFVFTETQFFSILRGGSIDFERIPVDGSAKMPDELMESIEPFDFSESVDFRTAYLSGYLADKYDIGAEQSTNRANQRIRKSTEEAFSDTVRGYATVTAESTNKRLNNGKIKYALYPVWLLNSNWNGKKYTFAMNGQTGRFVGDLPMDKRKYVKWLLGLAAAVSAAVFAITYLIWLL